MIPRDNGYKPMRKNYCHLNVGIRFKSACIPPVNTVHHGAITKSLSERNYKRRGSELKAQCETLEAFAISASIL